MWERVKETKSASIRPVICGSYDTRVSLLNTSDPVASFGIALYLSTLADHHPSDYPAYGRDPGGCD
jgi:hypothetical protein